MPMAPDWRRSCPTAPSWPALVACIAQFSRSEPLAILKDLGDARVVQIPNVVPPQLALYVRAGVRWTLAGSFAALRFAQLDVIAARALPFPHLANGSAYQIEVGERAPAQLIVGDVARQGEVVRHHVLLCGGDRCFDLVSSCDAIADGLVVSTFHGRTSIDEIEAATIGDASLAAPNCAGEQHWELRAQ